MSKKYLKWIIGVAVVAVIGIGIYLVTRNAGGVPVERVEVSSSQVKRTVSASGTVKSRNQANLAFPTVGTLEEIAVDEGQQLQKGDFIAYVYNQDTLKSVEAAKETLNIAEKDLEIYKENYSTNLSAVGGEDEYYLNVEKLEKQVQKARASYESSLASLSKTRLYAPFDGTVIDIFKDENEVVGVGETVVKFANPEDIYFEIAVEQEDFGLIAQTQGAVVDLDAYNNESFDAVVKDFTKYIDESTNDFIVKLDFSGDNKDKIYIGMQGDANVTVAQTETEVPALAFDQVFSENGNYYVWTVENGKLVKLPVEIGLEGDIYTQIKTDLSNKTVVVPSETENVKEGMGANILNR